MSECEQVQVQYWVKASFSAQEDGEDFGPVGSRDAADALLIALAGRGDIVKATLRKELI